MINFNLNGEDVTANIPDDTPLLWAIRDHFGLKGTKFGCGIAMCGACTVHIDGVAQRSCILPVNAIAGRKVLTIESLKGKHPLQKAWVDEQVPQCGYCQSGQIMQAAALLDQNPSPTDDEIDSHMNGNLCRCMAYIRIKRAIKTAARDVVGQHSPIKESNTKGQV